MHEPVVSRLNTRNLLGPEQMGDVSAGIAGPLGSLRHGDVIVAEGQPLLLGSGWESARRL